MTDSIHTDIHIYSHQILLHWEHLLFIPTFYGVGREDEILGATIRGVI